jgi:hypothetical protein
MKDDERKKLRYYGSDLNQFIAENCKKEMTVMNIDLITYDISKKHIRIIESKHLNEKVGKGQLFLLKTLRSIFKLVTGFKIDVFIIRGNPPYDWVYVEGVSTGKRKKLKRQELIDFLDYKG